MGPRRRFVWQGFGGIPASIYGWLYILLIPIYGLIYLRLPPDSFYHSTVQYEQVLSDDAQQIISDFERNLVHRLQVAYPDGLVETKGWKFNISDVHVSSFQATGDSLTFGITVTMTKDSAELGHILAREGFKLSYPANKHDLVADLQLRPKFYYKYPTFDPPVWKSMDDQLDYTVLFPTNRELGGTFQRAVVLPPDLNGRIENFRLAYHGFPSSASGQVARMMYLSAITITTVGYGDIVPMSTLARTLVASEAVIGVVVIGLFLNALVQARKSGPTSGSAHQS